MTTPPDTTSLPLLPPRQSASGASDEALQELRRFHFAPPARLRRDAPPARLRRDVSSALLRRDASPEAAPATGAHVPALLHAWRRTSRPGSPYPVLLAPAGADEHASCVALPDLLLRAAPQGGEALRDRLEELADRVRQRLADTSAPVDARSLLEELGKAPAGESGEAAGGPLAEGLERLRLAVPAQARLLPESDQAPLHLLMQATGSRLLPARVAFREEARSLAAEAEGLLAADRQKRPESRSATAAGSALGELGSRFLDPAALSGVLDRRSGGTALSDRRKQRLEGALAALEEYLAAAAAPALILVHDGRHGIDGCETLAAERLRASGATGLGSWRVELHDDPCAAAAEIFDREAAALARVLRAVRLVRLEADGKYDPERLDPWLERFDWQAFSRQELLLLTPVVALVAADRVAGPGMVSLSGLLRSGRPVQVLVPVDPAANPGTEGAESLAGFRFEPAYLGLCHREVLVQQTSTATPAHMLRGFLRALSATHAGLHVVSASRGAELQATAALEARAHPLFHYDPEAGPSWAERLDFSLNPQAEVDWPVHALETRRPDGSRETLELAFTFADFALLEPAFAHHFHAVADGVQEVELVPAAEFAEQPTGDEAAAIPYVWAVDEAPALTRLAISRPLALACRDRLDFWRILQELSGVRSEHVRRAKAMVREELEEQAAKERAALEARHAQELERVRDDAARDVVDRLTSALLEVDVASFAAPAPALAGLAGRDVDSVAAALLQIVDVASLEDEPAAAGAADGVEKLASDLLSLVESAES